MFESNLTRQAFCAAYTTYSLKVAIENVDEFYSSWKDYRGRNPVERASANAAGVADGEVDLDFLMGGDTDDEVPLFVARAPAAAEAVGPRPRPQERRRSLRRSYFGLIKADSPTFGGPAVAGPKLTRLRARVLLKSWAGNRM